MVPEKNPKNKWMWKSYQAALKLTEPVSVEEFNAANEIVLAKVQKSPTKPAKRTREPLETESLSTRIQNLHRKLDHKIFSTSIPDLTKRAKYSVLMKKSEILNTYTILHFSNGIALNGEIDQIVSCFEKILQMAFSQKLFNSTKLKKIVKLFKHCLEINTETDVKRLVGISGKFLKYWERAMMLAEFAEIDEGDLGYKQKRNQVYAVLSNLLEEKGIAVLSCRSAAVKIEKIIRNIDPEMGALYDKKYREIVDDISSHWKLTLEDIVEKYYNTPSP